MKAERFWKRNGVASRISLFPCMNDDRTSEHISPKKKDAAGKETVYEYDAAGREERCQATN